MMIIIINCYSILLHSLLYFIEILKSYSSIQQIIAVILSWFSKLESVYYIHIPVVSILYKIFSNDIIKILQDIFLFFIYVQCPILDFSLILNTSVHKYYPIEKLSPSCLKFSTADELEVLAVEKGDEPFNPNSEENLAKILASAQPIVVDSFRLYTSLLRVNLEVTKGVLTYPYLLPTHINHVNPWFFCDFTNSPANQIPSHELYKMLCTQTALETAYHDDFASIYRCFLEHYSRSRSAPYAAVNTEIFITTNFLLDTPLIHTLLQMNPGLTINRLSNPFMLNNLIVQNEELLRNFGMLEIYQEVSQSPRNTFVSGVFRQDHYFLINFFDLHIRHLVEQTELQLRDNSQSVLLRLQNTYARQMQLILNETQDFRWPRWE